VKELIGIAVIIATLYGGSRAGEKIFVNIREAALTKAAKGLPSLSAFGHSLQSKETAPPRKDRRMNENHRDCGKTSPNSSASG
jgi:hypothetical protein